MIVRTDQLLHIAEATNSKIYTQESQAKAHCQMKPLVLSLNSTMPVIIDYMKRE